METRVYHRSRARQSRFHADQMALWVAGTTHPAPLSRRRVEALLSSRFSLVLTPAAAGR